MWLFLDVISKYVQNHNKFTVSQKQYLFSLTTSCQIHKNNYSLYNILYRNLSLKHHDERYTNRIR